jgi:hypothetical protein
MQNDVNARMNWFERHLNWTALGMGVGSLSLTAFLVIVGMGWDVLDIRGRGVDIKSGVLLFLVILSSLLFSATSYGWILYKKNRSPVFLLFFLPSLAHNILLLTNYTVYTTFAFISLNIPFLSISLLPQYVTPLIYNQDKVNPLPALLLLQIIVLGIGWFILLILKNRSSLLTSTRGVFVAPYRPHFLQVLFNSNKRVGLLLLLFIIVSVVLAGISLYSLKFGYSSFKYTDPGTEIEYGKVVLTSPDIPVFSFEYPSRFSVPYHPHTFGIKLDGKQLYGTSITFYDKLFFSPNEYITVESYRKEATAYLINRFGINGDGFIDYVSGNYTQLEEYEYDNVGEKLSFTSYMAVDSITARVQITHPVIDSNKIRYFYSHWESYLTADFIFKGRLWVITLNNCDPKITQSPAYFTHLLETFKIYDE